MYTKITNTSLQTDAKSNTWLFLAFGIDGSMYKFNTFSSVKKNDKKSMFKKLRAVVKDGFINTDYWRISKEA